MGNISRIEVKKHEANSQNFDSKNRKPCCSKTRSTPADRVLFLQRTIGNQAVQRLRKSGALQAKLRIGAFDDRYEQQADRVTEQVMRMPDPVSVPQSPVTQQDGLSIQNACRDPDNDIQRKEDDDEEERIVHMKHGSQPCAAGSQPNVPPIVYEVLSSPGLPLDPATRAYMEPRFGYDFSRVRVHSGAAAEQSATEVNANAYTVGHNIVFGAGRFKPGTQAGRRLLAHELTHTIQQDTGLKRKPDRFKIVTSNKKNEITARAIMHMHSSNNHLTASMQIARQTIPDAGAQPPPCPVAPLAPITDPDALAMEGGTTLIWNNTSPGLQAAANQLVALITAEPAGSATITSAYRPQAYQNHLREVWDKARALQGNTSPECAAVRAAVNQEMTHHSLNVNRLVAAVSNHTGGNAVDISWSLPNSADEEARIDALAGQAGLTHPLHANDRPHFEL